MMIFLPNYYQKFKCIADQCRHNCCTGWEIDIDQETYKLYQTFDGDLGEKLKNSISLEDGPHFLLDERERCPFLSENGLCEIISQKGESALCQICTDHPRFRNSFTHFDEMGLGLCCEEAARIILEEEQKASLLPMEEGTALIEDWESDFLKKREKIFSILQNRTLPYRDRIHELKKHYPFPAKPMKDWVDILLKAEKMEPELDEYLSNFEDFPSTEEPCYSNTKEQLSFYFIYRHLSGAMEDGLFNERLAMAIGFTEIICAIAHQRAGKFSLKHLIDAARLFSSEIEYSDQNIDWILENI